MPPRVCDTCGKEKKVSSYLPAGTATTCRQCQRTKDGWDKNEPKTCDTCGETKPRQSFASASSPTCLVCRKGSRAAGAPPELKEHVNHKEAVKEAVRNVKQRTGTAPTPRQVSAIDKELAARVLARRRLLPFVQRFSPEYQAGWVHKDICRRLERFAEQIDAKQSPRLMLLMPPRHGKSTLASQHFPAWYLGARPKHEVVAASHTGALALDFSRVVRATVRDPAYGSVFPGMRLDPDTQALEKWMSTEGGSYTAVGVGGSLTGKGAHCLIIDDPIKNLEEADSQTIRDAIFGWYASTARTRLAPGGGILLIQTWWHDDDLAGRLQVAMGDGGEQFEVVKYPAINEGYDEYLAPDDSITQVLPGEKPQPGSRLLRRADSALHPERYDLKELQALKASYIATNQKRVWTALYQQNPIPDEGLEFTKAMFQWYDDVPDLSDARIIQAWDFAITEKQRNDWTVGMCIAQMPDDDLYILDMRRFKSDDSIIISDTLIDFFRRHKAFVMGVEDGQIWKTMTAIFNKRCCEERIYPSMHLNKPITDKKVRASPLRGRMQQGKVFFPRKAQWVGALEQELLRFPAGKHDDCVDALAWAVQTALNFTAPTTARREPQVKSWRDKLRGLPGSGGGFMSA